MEATTQGKAELISALAKATLEYEPVTKDGKADVTTKAGGKYSYGYATLDQIINATKTALSNNGLVISHTTKEINGQMWLVSKLRHESGCKSDKVKSQIDKYVSDGYMSAVQSYGSIITYLKRYHVGMLLNIAIDEDTDASDSKSGGKTTQPKATTTKPATQGKAEPPPDIKVVDGKYKTSDDYITRINGGTLGEKDEPINAMAALTGWQRKHQAEINKMPADARKSIMDVFKERLDVLKKAESISQDDPELDGLSDGEKEHNPPD